MLHLRGKGGSYVRTKVLLAYDGVAGCSSPPSSIPDQFLFACSRVSTPAPQSEDSDASGSWAREDECGAQRSHAHPNEAAVDEIDISDLIEATLDSELIAEAADHRFEDQLFSADERRRVLRDERERCRERFIALLLRVANRPRGCHVRASRNASLAA